MKAAPGKQWPINGILAAPGAGLRGSSRLSLEDRAGKEGRASPNRLLTHRRQQDTAALVLLHCHILKMNFFKTDANEEVQNLNSVDGLPSRNALSQLGDVLPALSSAAFHSSPVVMGTRQGGRNPCVGMRSRGPWGEAEASCCHLVISAPHVPVSHFSLL